MQKIEGNSAVIVNMAMKGNIVDGETVFSTINNCAYKIIKTDESVKLEEVE